MKLRECEDGQESILTVESGEEAVDAEKKEAEKIHRQILLLNSDAHRKNVLKRVAALSDSEDAMPSFKKSFSESQVRQPHPVKESYMPYKSPGRSFEHAAQPYLSTLPISGGPTPSIPQYSAKVLQQSQASKMSVFQEDSYILTQLDSSPMNSPLHQHRPNIQQPSFTPPLTERLSQHLPQQPDTQQPSLTPPLTQQPSQLSQSNMSTETVLASGVTSISSGEH